MAKISLMKIKNLFLAAMAVLAFTSCSTYTNIPTVKGIEHLKREDYTLLDQTTAEATTETYYILGIRVFRNGPALDWQREEAALYNMLSVNRADGALAQKYVHDKFRVPLIVFKYRSEKVLLTAKPYVLKTGDRAPPTNGDNGTINININNTPAAPTPTN